MGRVIRLDTKVVVPIDDTLLECDLKKITSDYLHDCYEGNQKKMIVPVRIHPYDPDRFVLLDGHHSSCIADTLNDCVPEIVKIYGFLVRGEKDLMPCLSEEFHQAKYQEQNRNIRKNYLNAERYISRSSLPSSIPELREEYPVLRSAETLVKFALS